MDKRATGLVILTHMLPHVPFEGWTQQALARGAREAGCSETDMIRAFPGGAGDALALFVSNADAVMLEAYAAFPAPQKIRARIASLVRFRLEALSPHKEAVRRALAWYALPMHASLGTAALARTVDAMWRAAGDESTDFNWYTKRALLSGVYSSTLLFWLNDASADHSETWAFLDRRIADVMKIEGWKQRLRAFVRRA